MPIESALWMSLTERGRLFLIARAKPFNLRDALGLVALPRERLPVGRISTRPSTPTPRNARELKIDFLPQEKGGKVPVVESFLAETQNNWSRLVLEHAACSCP